MNRRTLIFDMDGTLLDTLTDLTAALNHSLAYCDLPTRSIDEARRFVGNGIRKLVERGVPENTPPNIIDKAHAEFLRYYSVHCADSTQAYAGIAEALAALKAAGHRVAVVSNKNDAEVHSLVDTFFPNLMDAAAGVTPDVRPKPAPDMVLRVLKTLGSDESEAVYIGDSEVDLQTAVNANLPCVSVLWGFRERAFLQERGATCFIERPEVLAELFGEKA